MLHAHNVGRVEAWILAKPVSTSASEISSQAGEGDFDDEILVDTPKQHEVQVLVVHTQNGANMATSSTTTAAGTTITAQSTAASTAALQVAGPSTKEPIVEQLGQDIPSVIQGAHPEQRYGSQPYFSGQQYTAPTTAAQPYTAVPQPYTTATQPYIAPYKRCNVSPSPKRDYPRGTCTVTRPSQASPRKAEHTVTPAQDLEAFKADMTSMLSDMLQASFQKFASQFNTNSGG